jgi:hypothetical protein
MGRRKVKRKTAETFTLTAAILSLITSLITLIKEIIR